MGQHEAVFDPPVRYGEARAIPIGTTTPGPKTVVRFLMDLRMHTPCVGFDLSTTQYIPLFAAQRMHHDFGSIAVPHGKGLQNLLETLKRGQVDEICEGPHSVLIV